MLKSRATAPRNLINQWPESPKLKKRSVMLPLIRCPPSTIHGLANVSGLELGYDLGLVCLSTYVPSIRRPRFFDFLPPVKSVPIWCYESPLNANFCFYHKIASMKPSLLLPLAALTTLTSAAVSSKCTSNGVHPYLPPHQPHH